MMMLISEPNMAQMLILSSKAKRMAITSQKLLDRMDREQGFKARVSLENVFCSKISKFLDPAKARGRTLKLNLELQLLVNQK